MLYLGKNVEIKETVSVNKSSIKCLQLFLNTVGGVTNISLQRFASAMNFKFDEA